MLLRCLSAQFPWCLFYVLSDLIPDSQRATLISCPTKYISDKRWKTIWFYNPCYARQTNKHTHVVFKNPGQFSLSELALLLAITPLYVFLM